VRLNQLKGVVGMFWLFAFLRLALLMLWEMTATGQSERQSDMKITNHVPLRFLHSSSANFTLRIQKKPVNPYLFPFSSKKLASKEVKYEWGQNHYR